MASRFAKKPDPAIRNNVRQARAAAATTKRANASVVVASIAAILFAWALFSNHDAQALRAAQLETTGPAAAAIAAPPQSEASTRIIVPLLPARLAIAR